MEPSGTIRVRVAFKALFDAYEMADMGPGVKSAAYIRIDSGEVIVAFDFVGEKPGIPADLDDEDKYIVLPDRRDLNLGARLPVAFARERMPADSDYVSDIFHRRGAYRRFKNLLIRRGNSEVWFAYRDEATREALRQWCAENGVGWLEADA